VQKKLPKLGELEVAVLEKLWHARELDVAEAHAAVGAQRGITPNTVGSALERLFRKGLVSRRKVSHAFRYAPLLESDEFAARRVLDAAGGLGKLASTGLLAAFVDLVADHDDKALERLSALVAEKRRRRGAR
jgi:predicted transcriptional regulator